MDDASARERISLADVQAQLEQRHKSIEDERQERFGRGYTTAKEDQQLARSLEHVAYLKSMGINELTLGGPVKDLSAALEVERTLFPTIAETREIVEQTYESETEKQRDIAKLDALERAGVRSIPLRDQDGNQIHHFEAIQNQFRQIERRPSMDDLEKLNREKNQLAQEAYRLSADGLDASHVTKRMHEIDYQLELKQQRQQAQTDLPTEKQIRIKQRVMDSEVLDTHPAWPQRTSRNTAQMQVLGDRNAALREDAVAEYYEQRNTTKMAVEGREELSPADIARKARADVLYQRAELSAAKPNAEGSEPKRSQAQWAQQYEMKTNADRSISYHRDGAERFQDRGNTIGIRSSDERSIRDAVSLAKEKWGNTIEISTKDQQKRESIMRAMAQQNMKLGNQDPAMQKSYAEISKQVERERLQRDLARPQRVEETQKQTQSQVLAQ